MRKEIPFLLRNYGASGDNPAAIETTASYDAFRNIIAERRANGSKTLYFYAAKNRVTEKRQYNAAGAKKYKNFEIENIFLSTSGLWLCFSAFALGVGLVVSYD